MKKAWLFPILLIFTLAAGFFYVQYFRLPLSKVQPAEAVPVTTPVIFELKNDTLRPDSLLAFSKLLKADMGFFEQVFSSPVLPDTNTRTDLAIGWMPLADNNWAGLYIFRPTQPALCDSLAAYSDSSFLSDAVYKDNIVHTLQLEPGLSVTWTCMDGLFLISRFSYLVEDGIRTLSAVQKNLFRQPGFKIVYQAQKSRFGHWYFQNEMFPDYFKNSPALAADFPWREWIEWSGWTVRYQNDKALGLEGEMASNLFLPKDGLLNPQHDIAQCLPDNTALLWLRQYDTEDLPSSGDFGNWLQPWLEGEIAFAVTEPYNRALAADYFVVAKTKSQEQTRRRLAAWGDSSGVLSVKGYQAFTITQYLTDNLFASLFGAAGATFDNPYTVLVEDFVIFSNNQRHLERWLDKYIAGQTLSKQVVYLQRFEEVTQFASSYLYLNLPLLKPAIERIAGRSDLLRGDLFKNYENVFLGWRKRGRSLHAQAALLREGAGILPNIQGVNIAWKAPLNQLIAGPPQIVRDTSGHPAGIVAQDKMHQLYFFTKRGALAWHTLLDGPLLSDVRMFTPRGRVAPLLIFNTATQIYLLDLEGRDVGTFPLRLQAMATNGMLLTDFQNTGDFTFFVACENENLYGFEWNGLPLAGWNPRPLQGIVQLPIRHFQLDKKDYIAALTTDGELSVFRRDGELCFEPVQLEGKAFIQLEYQVTPGYSRFIALSEDGKIHNINPEGAYFTLQPLRNQKISGAVIGNFTGDNRQDFAYLTQQSLSIYFYNKKDAFISESFPLTEIKADAIFKVNRAGAARAQIGLSDRRRQHIYLLDADGNIQAGFPLAGSTPFSISPLFADGSPAVVTGLNKAVVAYHWRIK